MESCQLFVRISLDTGVMAILLFGEKMRYTLEKYNKLSIQAKSAIWFAMCSILQRGISFITVPIFTRLLSTEEYGTYSLYLSWLQILTIITSLYLYHGVFNNGMVKFEDRRDEYISSMQGLTLTITFGAFCIYCVAYHSWSGLLGLSPVLVLMMFLEMSVTPAFHFWAGRQRFENQYKRLVILTLSKSLVNPLLGIVLVLLSKDRATARIISVVVTEIVFCGSLMTFHFLRGRRFFQARYWKYALSLAIPLLPHYLSGMILNQGDRIMIDRMVGKSEVAFYSVAYNIGMLVQIVTHAISNSFTPWMYQKMKKHEYSGIKGTVNILLLIVAMVSFGLMAFSPELVVIFGSEKYASAVYVIPPVAASVFFIFLYNMLAIPQFYFEKTKFLAVSSFIAAVTNVILNYYFINMFGFVAAGYTTLACYILYSLGHYLVSRKVLIEYLNGEELYDSVFIFALSACVFLAGIFCCFLFDYIIIRYTIIAAILLGTCWKRKQFVSLLKTLKSRE